MIAPCSPRSPSPTLAESLERVRAAAERYTSAQRRRDAAYDNLLTAIRHVAESTPDTRRLLAAITGMSRTRIRQILAGPVNGRDAGDARQPQRPESR